VVVGPHGTPDEPKGTSVFAWKGETLDEYWWACEQALTWPDADKPVNMIVDDGGDATLMVLRGMQYEKAGVVPPAEEDDPTELKVFLNLLRKRFETDKSKWTKIAESVKGVSEETTTGVLRLYQYAAAGNLTFPAINVNDSVTKSKFDNKYGCRHSLIDGINRGTDVLIGGKNVLICGYGDVGKGCAESMKGQGARVTVTEIDPINGLQALMEGYDVKTVEDVVSEADIIVTATGNKDIVTLEHMKAMKDQAILGNIGHFDNEIQMAALERSGATKLNIRPQVDLWTKNDEYDNEVYRLPKHLDEKVARVHVEALGGKLTRLTKDQAEYIGVDVDGPYKADHYRY
jgi:adenosylhomocysteinase